MGELETAVMEVLWDSPCALNPGQVQSALHLNQDLAYTTVMTILGRLWKKGKLDRAQSGRAFVYWPLQNREEYTADQMNELLVKAKDRPLALSYFVSDLKPADQDRLRHLLSLPQESS